MNNVIERQRSADVTVKGVIEWEVIHESQISEADVMVFAQISGDDNDLHFDDSFAKRCGFPKGRIVHGLLVLSRLSAALKKRFGHGVMPILMEQLAFRRPVYVGVKIKCLMAILSHEVTSVRDKWTVRIEIRANDKTVVTAENLHITRRRGTR